MGPHAALSSGLSCDAPRAGGGCAIGGGALADHVEFDFARQLDELHVGISFCGRAARSQSHRLSVAVLLAARMFGWFRLGDRVTHAPNIFPAGYEFEGDGVTIS